MLLSSLVAIPLISSIYIASVKAYNNLYLFNFQFTIKEIALLSTIFNFLLSLIIYLFFNNSTNQFQYTQEHYNVQFFDLYLGIDGISIYFILLTTLIMPLAILSNWDSIKKISNLI